MAPLGYRTWHCIITCMLVALFTVVLISVYIMLIELVQTVPLGESGGWRRLIVFTSDTFIIV